MFTFLTIHAVCKNEPTYNTYIHMRSVSGLHPIPIEFLSFKPLNEYWWTDPSLDSFNIDELIPRWIASSSPCIFPIIVSWMLFLQLVRPLLFLLYGNIILCLLCIGISMGSILNVVRNTDNPSILGTANIAIHALYTVTNMVRFLHALVSSNMYYVGSNV